MTGDLCIRPALPGDAALIHQVHVASVREVCSAHYTPEEIKSWIGPRQPEHYRWSMTKGGDTTVVAEENGEIVGFGSLKNDQIKGLYVAPGHLRRGIGRRLLDRLEGIARERDTPRLRLASSLTAVPFYAAHGYRVACHGQQRFFTGGQVACVFMDKAL